MKARQLWDRSKDKCCWYCGNEVARIESTVDHQVPQIDGGKGRDNLVLACRVCNLRKGSKSVEDFRAYCMVWWSPYGEIIKPEQALRLLAAGAILPAMNPVVFHGEKLVAVAA